jgi:AraC-like DNA-binding protein
LPSSNARLFKNVFALAFSGPSVKVNASVGYEIADKVAERIRAALAGGMSVRKTAAKFEVNPSTVQRIARPFGGAEDAGVAT